MSTSVIRRRSASPIVTSVFTSASSRASRGAALGAVSRVDHHTCAGDPGSSVASTIVRPFAEDRRSTRPGETRTSVCSPGTSKVAVALPAGGTGITNEPRPGVAVIAAPHSSVAENVDGPSRTATCVVPSAMSGSGPPAIRASISVAPTMSGTLMLPVRKTSPSTCMVARTMPAATRARISVRVSVAATGGTSPGRRSRAARSSIRS